MAHWRLCASSPGHAKGGGLLRGAFVWCFVTPQTRAADEGLGERPEQVVGERGRFGEGDGGFGPGEESGGDEVLDQEPGALLVDVEEPGQFGEAVSGLGALAGECTAFDHLDGGDPGAE